MGKLRGWGKKHSAFLPWLFNLPLSLPFHCFSLSLPLLCLSHLTLVILLFSSFLYLIICLITSKPHLLFLYQFSLPLSYLFSLPLSYITYSSFVPPHPSISPYFFSDSFFSPSVIYPLHSFLLFLSLSRSLPPLFISLLLYVYRQAFKFLLSSLALCTFLLSVSTKRTKIM